MNIFQVIILRCNNSVGFLISNEMTAINFLTVIKDLCSKLITVMSVYKYLELKCVKMVEELLNGPRINFKISKKFEISALELSG